MKNSFTGDDVVRAARLWIGTPYLHQASLKSKGCDCLGMVRGIWRELQGEEPESTPSYTGSWAEFGGTESLLDAARRHFVEVDPAGRSPGDVLVFRLRPTTPAKHMAIDAGDEKFIHAYDGARVVENSLSDFWRARICAVFRFPGVMN